MENFDILHPGVWFGPKSESALFAIEASDNAKIRLEKICLFMKSGDFSLRPQLESLILSDSDISVVRQAIRLYFFTCRHDDIEFVGKLMERLSHDEIITCISSAPDTLSPSIIPYLFALLGEYSDNSTIQDILASLHRMFPSKFSGDDEDLEIIARRFEGFGENLIPGAYYYQDSLAHPGELCKTLITTTAKASSAQKDFPLANIPVLLSVWSGIKCPLFYGNQLNSESLPKVMKYVQDLSRLPWEPGKKYFYQHEIK